MDSGSAGAFHGCARVSADFAHKAVAPFSPISGTGRTERDRRFESISLQRGVCEPSVPQHRHRFPAEIIQHAIWLYLRLRLRAGGHGRSKLGPPFANSWV
jgi:hypothetical protein